MSYDGPANTFENASVFDDVACTTPSPWVSNATVVTALDRASATAICATFDPSFVDAEHLATSGWALVSGAGVPGSPIAVNAWGCTGPGAPA